MIMPLALPVIAAVAPAHRYLVLDAPSNLLIRRARAAAPALSTAAAMLAMASSLIVALKVVSDAVAAGAPGWLNLVVLALAWDAIKLALVGVSTLLFWVGTVIGPKRRHDLGDGEFGRLVLPDPNHSPPSLDEQLVGVGVPLAVVSDLVGPEQGVGLRDRVMFGTTVPETAVNEYGDLRALEYEVRPPVQSRDRAVVDAISQACSVCCAADSQLGLGVATAVPLHSAADAWR